MKVFMLIFSFYMLLLSGLPCGDTDECGAQPAENISAPSGQKGHRHEKDNCTPFCNCACCAAPVSLQPITAYKFLKPAFAVKKYAAVNMALASSDLSSVWQPPRLS